ncbi:putative membrane protein [Gammaproteobacteria bacterium]
MTFLGLNVWQLPGLNAVFNTISTIFLILAFLFIRKKRVSWHRNSILMALGSSLFFLISYLVYHFNVGHVPYGGSGWLRWFYFTILLSHTLLAVVILPMIATAIFMALRHNPRHPIIGRITLVAWLYVSMTGVLIFLMLSPYVNNLLEQSRTETSVLKVLAVPKTEVKQNVRQ